MMKFFDKVLCQEKELLNLKGSKLGQILRADKTGFRRLDHIFIPLCVGGKAFAGH